MLSVPVSWSFIKRLCVSGMKNNPVFIKDNLTCFIVSCQIWRPRSSSTTRPFLCAYGDFRVLLSDSESTTPFLYTSASCCCNGSFCNFFRNMANAFRSESGNTKPSEALAHIQGNLQLKPHHSGPGMAQQSRNSPISLLASPRKRRFSSYWPGPLKIGRPESIYFESIKNRIPEDEL